MKKVYYSQQFNNYRRRWHLNEKGEEGKHFATKKKMKILSYIILKPKRLNTDVEANKVTTKCIELPNINSEYMAFISKNT